MGRSLRIMFSLLMVGAWVFAGCASKSEPETADKAIEESAPMMDEAPMEEEDVGMEESDAMSDMDATVSMPVVYFDFDRSTLNSGAMEKLRLAAEGLQKNTNLRVTIEGHCDERGSNEYNLALGERRADAVFNYLVRLGVDRNQLSTISYGEERPVEMGSYESAWAANRRAELVANQ